MTHWLADRLLVVIPLVLSLTVHEFAHAWAADRLGDDTARLQGRMTLDPLPHLDPIGTFVLPLLGVPIGWANPVPVNPGRFRLSISPVLGMALVAAAGPASNFVLAAVAWGLGKLVTVGAAGALLSTLVAMNLGLGLFNLLPIPPLDGSRVADMLIPDALRPVWNVFAHVGVVFVGILFYMGWMLWTTFELATSMPTP